MAGRLPNFNFQHVSPPLRDAIRSFISDEDILQVPDTAKMVEEYAKRSHQSYLWSGLLLLRGLLASNILLLLWSGGGALTTALSRSYDAELVVVV